MESSSHSTGAFMRSHTVGISSIRERGRLIRLGLLLGMVSLPLPVYAAQTGDTNPTPDTNVARGRVREIHRLKRGLDTGFEVLVENVRASSNGWILYFDGIPITNISPQVPITAAMNPADLPPGEAAVPVTIFQFEFSHDSANQAWRGLFAQAGFFRKSAITVGPMTGPVGIEPLYVAFKWLMIPGWRMTAAGVVYMFVLCLGIYLGMRKGMFKEDDGRGNKVFSLGRTQMAFWFFVVLGAYLFIGVMTGRWDGIIGTQALALIGISAALTLMSISSGTYLGFKFPEPTK
jgi:hypothetical protein